MVMRWPESPSGASRTLTLALDGDTVPGRYWVGVSDVPLVPARLAFVAQRAAVMPDLDPTREPVRGALRTVWWNVGIEVVHGVS